MRSSERRATHSVRILLVYTGCCGAARFYPQMNGDLRRESSLWAVVSFAEQRKSCIRRARVEILALGNALTVDPVFRIAPAQTALKVPASLDPVQLTILEMAFLMHGFLISVDPPFESVPLSVFDIAGFGKMRDPFFGLASPEID